MTRGRPQESTFASPYLPLSLIELSCRLAIASRYPSLAAFCEDHDDWSPRQLDKALPQATRGQAESIQNAVNGKAVDGEGATRGLSAVERWYLVALYDTVVGPQHVARHRTNHLEGDLPAHHFAGLCNAGPARSKPEVLVRAMAMRSLLAEMDTRKEALDELLTKGVAPLPSTHGRTVREAIEDTVRDLCILAVRPPNMGGLEATRLLAEAGTIALDEVRSRIEAGAPGSWRLVRVATECLRRCGGWDRYAPSIPRAFDTSDRPWELRHPRDPYAVQLAAARLLEFVDDFNPPNEYRARSLWEEAVDHLPLPTLLPERLESQTILLSLETFPDRLRRRILDGHTRFNETTDARESLLPVRERTTALWTYASRELRSAGWDPGKLQPMAGHGTATERVRSIAADVLQANPDRGLAYAAEFLRTACSDTVFWPWPEPPREHHAQHGRKLTSFERARRSRDVKAATQSWWTSTREAEVVLRATDEALIDVTLEPGRLVETALRTMTYQALLTIDGVARRQLLDTLAQTGLDALSARIFAQTVRHARPHSEDLRWLIEVAAFSLGWMEQVELSWPILSDLAADPDLDDSVRTTALRGLADMAERIQLHDETHRTRYGPRSCELATRLIESSLETGHVIQGTFSGKPIIRSSVYLLAMMRRSDANVAQLLVDIAQDPSGRFEELTTRALAQWTRDRNLTSEAVDQQWQSLTSAPGHNGASLRRLVDPMDSLHRVSAT